VANMTVWSLKRDVAYQKGGGRARGGKAGTREDAEEKVTCESGVVKTGGRRDF